MPDFDTLTRPIIGIKNRTAQEVFDIMCDRIRAEVAPPPSPHLMGATAFPSKEEINHLARLALEEMQREATTDPAAWIASYERIIMSYRRLALAKQQDADRASPQLHANVRSLARLLKASRPYVEDRLHRQDGELDGSVAGFLSKIDAALAATSEGGE